MGTVGPWLTVRDDGSKQTLVWQGRESFFASPEGRFSVGLRTAIRPGRGGLTGLNVRLSLSESMKTTVRLSPVVSGSEQECRVSRTEGGLSDWEDRAEKVEDSESGKMVVWRRRMINEFWSLDWRDSEDWSVEILIGIDGEGMEGGRTGAVVMAAIADLYYDAEAEAGRGVREEGKQEVFEPTI